MSKKDDKVSDKELWGRVARTVSPLKKSSSKPEEKIIDHMRVAPAMPAENRSPSHSLATRQDKKTRRGKVEIDAKIDLHDMTQTEAFSALRRAVIRGYNHNKKCLLVVTGKGIKGQGVLRRSLPQWLDHPDLRHTISEFAPAHQRHGGTGAWYVFLKNSAKL